MRTRKQCKMNAQGNEKANKIQVNLCTAVETTGHL